MSRPTPAPRRRVPGAAPSARRDLPWRAVLPGVLLLWAALVVTIVAASLRGPIPEVPAGMVLAPLTVLGTVAAVSAALRGSGPRRARFGRWYLVAAYLALLTSCLGFAVVTTFPGPGDVARLAAVPFLFLWLLSSTTAPASHHERVRVALDIGVVVAAGATALWYFSFGPVLAAEGVALPVLAVAAAYPLADLVLVLGAAVALLRGVPAASRRSLGFAVVGVGALIVADLPRATASVHQAADGPHALSASGSGAHWVALYTGFCFLACAAIDQLVTARDDGPSAADRAADPYSVLPYLAIAGSYGLLLWVASGASWYPWGGLVVGALVLTALVVSRQLFVLRENQQLAVTDHLTGLATRRALSAALSAGLARAPRSGTLLAVMLLDMDGFKAVNDELGHDAGDELLRGFAQVLRTSTARSDTVGRLGGDEFAIVLTGLHHPDDAARVALRLLDAIARPVVLAGRSVVPAASIGVAVALPGEDSRELMGRADAAMYRAKRAGCGWALAEGGGQPSRLLVPGEARLGAVRAGRLPATEAVGADVGDEPRH